jgi:hypothetical protein
MSMGQTRLLSALVIACACGTAAAQSPAPNLNRQQRDLLQALIAATDAAAAQPATPDVAWQSHVMRASDGSHYVAFTIEPSASAPLPAGSAMLYLRLATSSEGSAPPIVERSAIREWLAGSRTDPRMLPRRNIAIGDMPAFGSGSIATRGPTPTSGSTDLQLLALERERARQAEEDARKKRRAELEGRTAAARDLLPFEDFDLASRSTLVNGARIITRAFTAGPGDYDLFIAYADPSAPKPAATVRVIRTPLKLPAARTAGLSTSSIILADAVAVRAAPFAPSEQASHPYSIGLMEITPARTNRYTRDRNLSVAFQVINAASTEAGMPDVAVTIRVVRLTGERESQVATLNPLSYNATTMPPDFNLRLGHPLFAALTAPLASLPRGDYRLKIAVSDRIAGTATATDADFVIVGTPSSLLAEAPPLGPPFTREPIFEPATLAALVESLTPAMMSPQLERALAVARSGKLVDLLIDEPVPAHESGIRAALTGLAFLSIGDASAPAHFQHAVEQGAPAGPAQFLLGCARAAQSRDADAIAAWQASLATGGAPPLTAQLLAEAYLRRNDASHALELVPAASAASSPAWIRVSAAARLAAKQDAAAATLLEPYVASHGDDLEAQWLLLHALYAQAVRNMAVLTAADRNRFTQHARVYIEANGRHAALAEEWDRQVTGTK